jgi:hypothetical protein
MLNFLCFCVYRRVIGCEIGPYIVALFASTENRRLASFFGRQSGRKMRLGRPLVIRHATKIGLEEISMALQSPKVRFQQPKYSLRIQCGCACYR